MPPPGTKTLLSNAFLSEMAHTLALLGRWRFFSAFSKPRKPSELDCPEISGRYGFATEQGRVQEERASVVTGTTTEKSSVTAGASWYHMDPLLTRDRDPPGDPFPNAQDEGVEGFSLVRGELSPEGDRDQGVPVL